MSKLTIKVHETKKSESVEDAIEALAKELGVSADSVSESSEDYSHYEPEYVLETDIDGEKAVFVVYDNKQSARDAAADDLGERFRDDYAILGAALEFFGFGPFSAYINGLNDEDMAELESLCDDLNFEEFARFVQNNVGVDYRGFAERNIDELGTAWHLAEYDSKEHALDNGMFAYRVE